MNINLNDLYVFTVIAKEKSFTKAAAKLATSQSAVSQIIKNLENRLGIQLLSRTTRSVSLTESGKFLLHSIEPALADIEHSINHIAALKEKPSGTLKINADEYGIQCLLWPVLDNILEKYPEISFEITSDYRIMDIVKEGYDVGLRRGKLLSKDMIAMKISDDTVMSVVASPTYLKKHGSPTLPKDLMSHRCISLKLSTHGDLFKWSLTENDTSHTVKINTQLTFTTVTAILQATKNHLGIAYLPYNMVKEEIQNGSLEELLIDWRYVYEPYYLYYPHRKEQSPILNVLINALRQ